LDRDRSQGITDLWRTIEALAYGEIEGELTPEVMRALLEQMPSARTGEFTTPQLVSDFISAVGSMFNPNSVLDPMCGSGLMLEGVLSVSKPRIIDGVDINTRTCEIARQVLGPSARIQDGDIFLADLDLQEEYDLVISDPPLRTPMRRDRINTFPGLRKQLDLGQNLVVWACHKITEDGAIIIVLDANALDRGPLVEAINAAGCRVHASFHVPVGTRPNTMVASQVLVVQRGHQGTIFVGQLSDEPEHQQTLLDNFKHHRFGKHPSLGRICQVAEFFGYEALEAAYTLGRRFRNTGYIAHPFKSLVKEEHRCRVDDADISSVDVNNALLLPEGGFRFYTDPTELSERVSRYFRFELDDNLVDARYLNHWLRTDIGEVALGAAGARSMVRRLSKPRLVERLVCYLPPLREQQETLKTVRRLEQLRTEIREIEADCWNGSYTSDELADRAETVNRNDRYEFWVESLPYPLASILWRHKVSDDDPRIKYKVLLHFFEALAVYMATVHLSAFISHEQTWRVQQERLLKTLAKEDLSLERATFGVWKVVVELLGKAAREMSKTPDQEPLLRQMYAMPYRSLDMILDPEIASTIARATSIRNTDDAHGGAIGKARAAAIEDELLQLVDQIRAIFGRGWQRYELIQAEKMALEEGGLFRVEAKKLMGTRSQFQSQEYQTSGAMVTGRLYLLEEGASEGLQLLPLVRMMSSPSDIGNACYFYNRVEDDRHRFVSYHFENESSVREHFGDTAMTVKRLTTLPALPGTEIGS